MYDKKYYKENKDKWTEYYRDYYLKHKAKIKNRSNKRYHNIKEVYEKFREQIENKTNMEKNK